MNSQDNLPPAPPVTEQPQSLPPSSAVKPSLREKAQGCGCLALIALAIFAFGPSMCDEKSESESGNKSESNSESEKPLEYKVAFLDSGASVAEDPAKVRNYRSVLDELAAAFTCTDEEIANMTRVVAKDLSADLSRNVTMLELMQAVVKLKKEHPSMVESGKNGYASQLAMLAVLMKHPNE